MILELGHFALALAFVCSLMQAALPLVARRYDGEYLARAVIGFSRAQFALVALAFAALTAAFVDSDFSARYVAENSNSRLPLLYRVSGVWGAHEGSLLLWALMIGGWSVAVGIFSRAVPGATLARVLSVLGAIAAGFLAFILFTSNPFARLLPPPVDGRDLNPLLQDPGLAFHPPLLYAGYVGFAVAFAFAVAALWEGRMDAAWSRWARPWVLCAWALLTLGIALGSYWAYYELGWGGWWFWDPVENASFLPWLVGAALVHSLAATEARGLFKSWSVLLALLAFALSMLGAFLVRSGVLTSVHAFASDPSRGVFLLVLLAIIVGGSLALYAARAPLLRGAAFRVVSREGGILANNFLLSVAAATVLLGTLYPLFLDALGLGKISVGPPYFNAVFLPLMAPAAALLGFATFARWKRDSGLRLLARLWPLALGCALAAAVVALVAPEPTGGARWRTALALALAFWVLAASATALWARWRKGAVTRAFAGMILAHVGFAVVVIGATGAGLYSQEKDVRLRPGETAQLGARLFRFESARATAGPNYDAQTGHIVVARVDDPARPIVDLRPEKRVYQSGGQTMTEAGIDAGFSRDLYVSLGEPLGDGAWSARLQIKPFIRWVWAGALFVALGAFAAAFERRYWRRR